MSQPSAPTSPTSANPVITPDTALSGTVVSYNEVGRFAVLSFPVGHMAPIGQRLFVYRNGFKVGELNVNGPQLNELVAADCVMGEAQKGDEVRDK